MKKKIPLIILAIILFVVVAFIFDIYFYGATQNGYCVAQARQNFPDVEKKGGTPSQEWFHFYNKCRDGLSLAETFRLMLGSKPMDCEDIVKGYLEMAKQKNQITYFGGGNTDWQRAIAIESEINNLCQMELTDEAIEGYAPTNIQKYLNEYRHN